MRAITHIIFILSLFGLFVFASHPNSIPAVKSNTIKVDTLVIDTAKSIIHWNCSQHYGKIKLNKGYLIHDSQLKEISVNIDMKSITNTDVENKLLRGTLENVLKSIEFFNTDIYPEARFESHKISKIKDSTYSFEGDFILFENGICSDFEGDVHLENDSLHLHTQTIILDRTDWGIYYLSKNNLYPKEEENGFIVSDSIMFDVHITAFKK